MCACEDSDLPGHPHEESLGPELPIEGTAKTLIRLGRCLGCSESSLSTQPFVGFVMRRLIYSQKSLFIPKKFIYSQKYYLFPKKIIYSHLHLFQIPFEVNRKNIRMLESLFDPSFGATVKGTDLLQWLIKLF